MLIKEELQQTNQGIIKSDHNHHSDPERET